MSRADLYTSLALIVFGAAVTLESWRMPRFENIGGSLLTAPGLVPGILGLVILVFGVLMLVRSLSARAGTLGDPAGAVEPAEARLAAHEGRPVDPDTPVIDEEGDVAEADVVESGSPRRLFLILGLSVLYAGGLVGRLPFWLATFLFVFAAIVLFEWRREATAARLRRLVVSAVVAGTVAYVVPFVFERIFLVNLP